MNQLSLFDILPKQLPLDVPCGYISDPDLVGEQIPFTDLRNYVGKKVVKAYEGGYKVYKVIEYIEQSDTFYKRVRPLPDTAMKYGEIVNEYIHDVVGQKEAMACYDVAFVCDRVALSDKEGDKKANAWISEAYCGGGRFNEVYSQYCYSCSFHKLLTAST